MNFRIVSIGEILYDVYPDNKYMGGAPFNFSFHLHNMGYNVAFISGIGRDRNGSEIKQFMLKNNMRTDFLTEDPAYRTGEVLVRLDPQGIPSFIIKENTAYDHIRPNPFILHYIESGVDLFYFGTLAQRQDESKNTLYSLLKYRNQDTIVLYDINLRQNFYSRDTIERSLSVCTILKANEQELSYIKGIFQIQGDEYAISRKIIELFDISVICVTKGSKGASLYTRDQQYHSGKEKENGIPHLPGIPVIDTVGAGDGFAAVLGAGLLLKWPFRKIVTEADRFAHTVCSIKGALPQDRSFYSNFF